MAPQLLSQLLANRSPSNMEAHLLQTTVYIIMMMLEKEPELAKQHIILHLVRPIQTAWIGESEVSEEFLEKIIDGLYKLMGVQGSPLMAEALLPFVYLQDRYGISWIS